MESVESIVSGLSLRVSSVPGVTALGLSSHPIPNRPSEGDIDLFVYCSSVPDPGLRASAYEGTPAENVKLRTFVSPAWGDADFMTIRGIETWLMYFDTASVEADITGILDGTRLDRENNYYYPVGRLAMFASMTVLSDGDGFLGRQRSRLAVYPDGLRRAMISRHLSALEDREDFLRSVERKDVLFYHFTLDLALDHLLQVLFALNRVYFPSRKRSFGHLDSFRLAPADVSDRLRSVIELGGRAESIGESYGLFDGLVRDVRMLVEA